MEIVRRDEDKQGVLLTFLGSCSRAEVGRVPPGRFKIRSGIPEAVHAQRTRPSRRMSAFLSNRRSGSGQAAICDLATTFLRQGLSTAIASTEARIFAPAATMKTLSQ